MTAKTQPNNEPNPSTPASPLRVVPPTSRIPTPPPQNTPPTQKPPVDLPPPPPVAASKPQAASKSSFPVLQWLVVGGILTAAAWVAQQPVPNSVRADARLEPAPDSYQVVYMEIPGTLSQFLVKPGKQVEKDEPVALISTEEMAGDISDARARFEEVVSGIESSAGRVATYNSKVSEAKVQEAAVSRQVEELRQELNLLSAGTPPPEIDRLYREIDSLRSRIQELQGQIEVRKALLKTEEDKISRYEELLTVGAIPQNEWEEVQKSAITLKGEMASLDSQIQQVESQIAAKQSEIGAASKTKSERLKELEDILSDRRAAVQTAEGELKAAQAEAESRVPLLKTLEQELTRKQVKQQNHSVLKAKTGGLVISSDFYKFVGKTMQPGEEVMQIADLSKLVGIVEVSQEDSDLVKVGAAVTFYPVEPGFAPYKTHIEKVDLVMQSDPSQQKKLLAVRAIVDNSQKRLTLGSKVYAEIESQPIPVYEKVRREFMKVFNFRKYGIGG